MSQLNRKQFLKKLGWVSASGAILSVSGVSGQEIKPFPTYLRGYEEIYHKDPRRAAIAWHRDSKWGLFVHHALASLRGMTAKRAIESKDKSSDQWKALKQGTAEEYAKLKDRFTDEKFDADFITDLAVAAQMRYVNFTTRHLGDLYMFRTNVSEFNSLNSPAKRDLVAEWVCNAKRKDLACFFIVRLTSHGPNRKQFSIAIAQCCESCSPNSGPSPEFGSTGSARTMKNHRLTLASRSNMH